LDVDAAAHQSGLTGARKRLASFAPIACKDDFRTAFVSFSYPFSDRLPYREGEFRCHRRDRPTNPGRAK